MVDIKVVKLKKNCTFYALSTLLSPILSPTQHWCFTFFQGTRENGIIKLQFSTSEHKIKRKSSQYF